MTEDELIAALRAEPGLSPPATPAAVQAAEEAIGRPLPALLRRLYLEVANGGFGPRDGVLGVPGSEYEHHDEWADIVDVHQNLDPPEERPGMVWLFDWGCATWSLLDCADPAGAMWGWDPGGEPELFPQNMTLAEWLAASLGGNLENAFETGGLPAIAARRLPPGDLRQEPGSRRLPGDMPHEPGSRRPLAELSDGEIVARIRRKATLPPPASATAVGKAEEVIGHPLPALLRRLYLEVANGGFGPGGGVLGVPDGPRSGTDIVECHELFTAGSLRLVPDGLVWLCDLGSTMWALTDCRDPAGPMWLWDPVAPGATPGAPLLPLNRTLAEWLADST